MREALGIRDGIRWLAGREIAAVPESPLQTRQTLDDLIVATAFDDPRRWAGGRRTWMPVGESDALGVPAVFRAVSLIANTLGVLSLEAFRNEVKLDAIDTPRVIIRPDPFNTPRVFFRDLGWHMARRGEAWIWIAKRDVDGLPLSLIAIDPREINVEENADNYFRPLISWRGVRVSNDDFRQITYLRDQNNRLRGIGPLQACGAALSVSVEAQEYAANWYAEGGAPSTIIKSATELSPLPDPDTGKTEADVLRDQWISRAPGVARVIDPRIEDVTAWGVNPEAAQLTQARTFQNGEIALAFGIPGTLLDHATQGVSITYQNVGQEYEKFVRTCLWPNYLEGIEQEMSDMLTRSTVARFNVDALLRADIKTRYETYNVGIPLGVLTTDEARAAEGRAPGSVENRPVPFAAPQALPTLSQRSKPELREIRHDCGTLVGRVSGAAELWCRSCRTPVVVAA